MSASPPAPSGPAASARASVRGSITPRAVVLALILIPANSYWVVQMELFRGTAHPTTISLFFNAVFTLLVVQTGNALLGRLLPRAALSRGELLLVYSMVAAGTAVTSHDFMEVGVCYPTISFFYATPENKWGTLINPRLPAWITVQDPRANRGYYLGGQSIFDPRILEAWGPALFAWSAFIMALLLVMVCLTALIRRQWLDHEHLACPLVRVPLEMTHPGGRLYRNAGFWIGFGLAALGDAWNAIRFYYPTMPEIRLKHYDMGQFIRGMPWQAVGWFPRSFYPFAIGMGYMMPSDFLFSCWFFYLFWKAEHVASAAFGLAQIKDFPFPSYQFFGAYTLFAVSSLWTGRRHLQQVWRHVTGRLAQLDDSGEPVPYSGAALGLLIGLLTLVWFTSALGVRPVLAGVMFIFYFIVAIAVTRMRAQFGSPVHDLHHIGPGRILTGSLGTELFTAQELTVMGVYYWFNRAYRGHPMPHYMEAMKLQEEEGRPTRGLPQWLLAAGFVAMLAGWLTILGLNYALGADQRGAAGVGSGEGYHDIARWMLTPNPLQLGPILAAAAGFGTALGLEALRFRVANWPLHPLGFAIAGDWQMNLVWMPLLIAWCLKSAAVRYGGHKTYQALMPLFTGLIIGEFFVWSVVNIICVILHRPSYAFLE
jgi:hypothetical protein